MNPAAASAQIALRCTLETIRKTWQPLLLFVWLPTFVLNEIMSTDLVQKSGTLIALLALLASICFFAVVNAVYCLVADKTLSNEAVDCKAELQKAIKILDRVVGAVFYSSVLILLGSILVIPGVWLFFRFFLVLPVAALEMQAEKPLSRSSELSRGNWLFIAVCLVLIYLPAMALAIASADVQGWAGPFQRLIYSILSSFGVAAQLGLFRATTKNTSYSS